MKLMWQGHAHRHTHNKVWQWMLDGHMSIVLFLKKLERKDFCDFKILEIIHKIIWKLTKILPDKLALLTKMDTTCFNQKRHDKFQPLSITWQWQKRQQIVGLND